MKTVSLTPCVFVLVSIPLPVLVVAADRVEPLPYRNILNKIHQLYAHFIDFFGSPVRRSARTVPRESLNARVEISLG